MNVDANKFPTSGYLLIWITCIGVMAATCWLLPPAIFVFGVGSFAAIFLVLVIMGCMLVFRKWILNKSVYRYWGSDRNPLLAHLQPKRAANSPEEEEIAAELLENALHLREVMTGDCMAPRAHIVHISADATIDEGRALFARSQLSRILVTEGGDLDKVIGYLHVQQLFGQLNLNIRSMVMPIDFVDTNLTANDLLNRFVRRRTNIACVKDSSGRLAGIVTLEDALEQLFGEINDEHD